MAMPSPRFWTAVTSYRCCAHSRRRCPRWKATIPRGQPDPSRAKYSASAPRSGHTLPGCMPGSTAVSSAGLPASERSSPLRRADAGRSPCAPRQSKPLVARFGGIPLIRQKKAVINDQLPQRITYPRRELIGRLSTARCELCERTGEMQVHHVRTLAELDASAPPPWATVMVRRRRKTLVVCADCHDHIHGIRSASTFTA
ncbi:HNH endonuclease [Amycolatopsis sulphurea]|uniref:HNH endonuclease n=1 Tax=Amycolatopsis sulphurea TaxID=76022 RepID=UPI003183E7DB